MERANDPFVREGEPVVPPAGAAEGMRRLMAAQYIKFFVNGTVLGLAAMALQHMLFKAMGGGAEWKYALASALAYLPVMVVNYMIQKRYVFRAEGLFPRFAAANLTIMVLVSCMSPAALWVVDAILGAPWGERFGFAVASVVGSVPSFLLKRRWVFGLRGSDPRQQVSDAASR